MDTQEAYEAIRTYFNRPDAVLAVTDTQYGPSCRYRTEDGAKCAVGCLIPDELYDPDIESKNCGAVLICRPSIAAHFSGVDPVFLGRAQRLHDTHAKDAEKFVALLDLLALAHGLQVYDNGPWL